MREDFLHYLWKYKYIDASNLTTTTNEPIVLIKQGEHNHNSGPDFFMSQLKINNQLWVGNVEIHVKSSDWYVHNHEVDPNYDNVILHVVWEHDVSVFRKSKQEIPTLELKHFVANEKVKRYELLFNQPKQWISCESSFKNVDSFILDNWIERLYIERLERKSKEIELLLSASKNNWEAVLFKSLAKNFGLKVNGSAFFELANSFDFSVWRKLQSKPIHLEALLFGQSGLLNVDFDDAYVKELKMEYKFLKQKFQLSPLKESVEFFRLRPSNFPTIRLSQLSELYNKEPHLFSKLMSTDTLEDIYTLFSVQASAYWESHYTLGKASKSSKKRLTKSFIDLLIINTLVPIKFAYAKQNSTLNIEPIISLLQQIKAEKNSVVTAFHNIKPINNSALQSQALLTLKASYCDLKKCLQCAIGSHLIKTGQ